MRALFFGTPAIAVPALDALCSIAEVVAVVCQPDRPAGRGLTLTPPPVKVRALELGLPVNQPTKVKTPEFAAWAKEQDADVALVIAYCLGLGLPFLVLAVGSTWAVSGLGWLRRNTRVIQVVGGLALIAVGIALVTGAWNDFIGWVRDAFISVSARATRSGFSAALFLASPGSFDRS